MGISAFGIDLEILDKQCLVDGPGFVETGPIAN
jgi:hypothetical protein